MQIDVEALRALIVVVDQASITRAAQLLHLSRSAVSWRMKRLEQHVGQELLVRDGRDLRPSVAARAILDDARTVVETHDRIARRLADADLTGQVTVGADNDVDVTCLTRVLGSFRRVHPGVAVNLVVDRGWDVMAGLDAGEMDLVVVQVTDDQLAGDDRILWCDSLVWATSRSCPPAEGAVPLVTYGEECPWRARTEPMLQAAGIDYRVALSVPSTAGVVSSLEDGLGVGVIPEGSLTERLRVWDPGADLDALPGIGAIVRIGPAEHSEVVELLADQIAAELCPAPALARLGEHTATAAAGTTAG